MPPAWTIARHRLIGSVVLGVLMARGLSVRGVEEAAGVEVGDPGEVGGTGLLGRVEGEGLEPALAVRPAPADLEAAAVEGDLVAALARRVAPAESAGLGIDRLGGHPARGPLGL